MYEVIKDEFHCVPRGIVDIRGKGEMETWFLKGVRTSPQSKGRIELTFMGLPD